MTLPNWADEAQETQTPLLSLQLLKGVEVTDEAEVCKFAGIASDESADVEGDAILKKALDLTYAKARGYVNWDHSREPQDQIGLLTACDLISGETDLAQLEKSFGVTLSRTASVFVSGELYKHVPKAQQVAAILKSTPKGAAGLGLSLDGMVARGVGDGGVVRAYVRGVAITPVPAHPRTMLQLRKSLQQFEHPTLADLPGLTPEASEEVVRQVVQMVRERLAKSVGMNHDEAVLWLLKQKPNWSFDLASKLVMYTMSRAQRS